MDLGGSYFACDDIDNRTLVSIYNIRTKTLVQEKDFKEAQDLVAEVHEDVDFSFVDNLKKVNEEILALYYYTPGQIYLYNWRRNIISGRIFVEAELILRRVGDLLIFKRHDEGQGEDE